MNYCAFNKDCCEVFRGHSELSSEEIAKIAEILFYHHAGRPSKRSKKFESKNGWILRLKGAAKLTNITSLNDIFIDYTCLFEGDRVCREIVINDFFYKQTKKEESFIIGFSEKE